MKFLKKSKKFSKLFSINVNPALFGICLEQKLFESHKSICFGLIQNGSKLNRVLQTSTEVCRQILGANHIKFSKECVMYMEKHVLVKNLITNGLNMGLPLQARVEMKKFQMQ